MLRHATRLAALVLLAAVTASSAMAATTAQLNDSRIGNSKVELQAQIGHSTDVIEFFTVGKRKWVIAARHSSCIQVSWQRACARARSTLAAHRWLLGRAEHRYRDLFFDALPTGGDMPTWLCLHRNEGSWTDTLGTYQGGLQMDADFASTYGPDFQARYGASPGFWPVWAQITAARRARDGWSREGRSWPARGYGPWPTRILCGV